MRIMVYREREPSSYWWTGVAGCQLVQVWGAPLCDLLCVDDDVLGNNVQSRHLNSTAAGRALHVELVAASV